ncbi:thermonuclease family protein [Rhizobium sp. TRM95111]|uniref:thermonuclease family protein n=1 Tax=Rhizobium alarense TaxID=2846851 RepID=UPI001F24D3CA|nr:thermonuclease family protein [Rhizobium alarense]MCF3638358.1 thermonuclease family protein [Rhizobium alarense]
MAKPAKTRRRTRSRRKAPARQAGLGRWLAAGAVLIAAILVYDNGGLSPLGAMLRSEVSGSMTAKALPGQRAIEKTAAKGLPDRAKEKPVALAVPTPGERPAEEITAAAPAFTGTWYVCASRKDNCIIDAQTILHRGKRIRIADIEAPVSRTARCDEERSRAYSAQMRLRELLNEGDFTLAAWTGKTPQAAKEDYRVLTRKGRSLGAELVRGGFARPNDGRPTPWCGSARS